MNKIDLHQLPAIEEDMRELRFRQMHEHAPALKAKGAEAKLWIFPSGGIQALNQWHWPWLVSHPEVTRRFGIEQAVKDEAAGENTEGTGRKIALKVGFFRVNYSRGTGALVVEGCRKHWRNKVKDAVFDLVAENSERIDTISVTLFNDEVSMVVARGTENLLNYDDQEKLNHIPLLSESARGKAHRIVHGLLSLEESGPNLDHLHALEFRLSNEYSRLATAKTPNERKQREAWIAQVEKEIEGEKHFLGLPATARDEQLSDDDLLRELGL